MHQSAGAPESDRNGPAKASRQPTLSRSIEILYATLLAAYWLLPTSTCTPCLQQVGNGYHPPSAAQLRRTPLPCPGHAEPGSPSECPPGPACWADPPRTGPRICTPESLHQQRPSAGCHADASNELHESWPSMQGLSSKRRACPRVPKACVHGWDALRPETLA